MRSFVLVLLVALFGSVSFAGWHGSVATPYGWSFPVPVGPDPIVIDPPFDPCGPPNECLPPGDPEA